jgi:mono/diheme cytochrome c family protein
LRIRTTAAALLAVAFMAAPAAAANVDSGQALVKKHCAKCHGTDGKGDGPAISLLNISPPPTDWTDKAKMSKMSDQELTKIIKDGGAAVGKSKHMPGYKAKLTDSQVADIVAYIRSLAK